MREILFKGKQVRNGEWIEGSLLIFNDGYCISQGSCGDLDDLCDIDFGYGFMEVDRETIGQYTGLKDKNEKRIFDGDIIKFTNNVDEIFHEEVGVCVFESADSGFCVQRMIKNPDNYPVPTTIHTIYLISNDEHEASYEIIGNIHDNPELLED